MPSKITVKAELGNEFSDSIEKAINDKLRVAQNKWGVALNKEQQDLVIRNTRLQLSKKLIEVYKHEQKVDRQLEQRIHQSMESKAEDNELDTEVEDPSLNLSTIYVTVKTKHLEKDVAISVGENYPKTASLLIARTSQGYIAADEETDSSVWLADFPEKIKKDILKWAKTAVFYGVGSFK